MDRPDNAATGQSATSQSATSQSATRQTAPASAKGLPQGNWLALVEFAIVALIFIADRRHLIPVSKTPFLLLLGWSSLRIRKRNWRDVGFSRNRSWAMTLTLGVGGGLLLEVFQLFVTQPLLATLTGKPPDLSDFRLITGNVKYALIGVALAWTLAAVGEELVWRGYLMNRVAGLRQGTRVAWLCSLLAVNALFGLAHSNQGLTGIIEEGIAGAFLAGMYLQTGKNLAVPILAHGTSDTVDVLLLFLANIRERNPENPSTPAGRLHRASVFPAGGRGRLTLPEADAERQPLGMASANPGRGVFRRTAEWRC